MSALPQRVDPDDKPQVEVREFIDYGNCDHCPTRGLVLVREEYDGNAITEKFRLCKRCYDE